MSPPAPRAAMWILRRALRDDPSGPAILGDLHEDFAKTARCRGTRAAGRWFWREAILLSVGRRVWSARRAKPLERGGSGGRSLRRLLEHGGYAVRGLGRAPGFALFSAVLIGLGVGAATSVFSVLKPFVLAPLPFEDPEALVWIGNSDGAKHRPAR